MKKIILFISVLAIIFGVNYARALSVPQVSIPDVGYTYDDSLAAAIGSGDTTMTLVRGTWKDGTSLSGYQCFTVDTGLSNAEYICGTANGTSITGLLRGIPPLSPATSVSSLKFSHRAGEDVRITDFPGLQIMKRLANGQDPYPNPLFYDPNVSTSTLAVNPQNIASVGYVNTIAIAGSPNASTTLQGLVQVGNIIQIASGTQNGSTGAVLFAPGSLYASSSPGTQKIVVSQTNGKINQNFLDLTQNFIFSGLLTDTNATTTLAATSTAQLVLRGINYVFPSTAGNAGQLLQTNGTGTLTWSNVGNLVTMSTSTLINSPTWNSGTVTTTIMSLTFTPTAAQKYLVSASFAVGDDTNAGGCNISIYIDNVNVANNLVNTVSSVGNNVFPVSLMWPTAQLSAISHTVNITGTTNGTGTCAVHSGSQIFMVINAGN